MSRRPLAVLAPRREYRSAEEPLIEMEEAIGFQPPTREQAILIHETYRLDAEPVALLRAETLFGAPYVRFRWPDDAARR